MVELLASYSDDREESVLAFTPSTLVIAGWTGSDEAAVQLHIEELELVGVARPKETPMFYRIGASLLTTSPVIQVVGREASGEVECVLWKFGGRLYVGLGSDHTDRKLEAVGITFSKQVCPKPISARVWDWDEVKEHWDQVELVSTLPRTSETYQHGQTDSMRRPDDLLELYETRYGDLPNGSALFCGTLPTMNGIRFADEVQLELIDPVLGRRLHHSYSVDVLPVVEE